MDATIAKQWIAELESGRYKKGKGQLHVVSGEEPDDRQDTFCCLGVLCRMAVRAGVDLEVRKRARELPWTPESRMAYNGETGRLPITVEGWAGMNGRLGSLPEGRQLENLAMINDKSEDFGPVADAIREFTEYL